MKMTENRRILLNVLVTYSRTIIYLSCSLFSVRWVLMALGDQDFGLYSVIGGLVVFMTFINSLFSSAVSRFYAYEQGRIKAGIGNALEECRMWFSAAFGIHTIIPAIVVAIGYPIGKSAIVNGGLAIPQDKIWACIWVWRFVCIDGLTGMMVAPIKAMYTAKQNIAELTVYSMLEIILKTLFIYSMTLVHIDWLVMYSLGICIIALLPRICFTIQAFYCFQECRFRRRGIFSIDRWRRLLSFVGWRCFMGIGDIAKGQGLAIQVNKSFGAIANAAMGVGTRLAGATAEFSSALMDAFSPAIMTACGAGQFDKMRTLAYRVCKYSTLLVLLFAIPLILEINEVLHLWLCNPPAHAEFICMCVVVACILGRCSFGHTIVVMAMGRISFYSFLHGMLMASVLIYSSTFVSLGYGFKWMGVAIVLATAITVFGDIITARFITGMSIRHWVRHVICPIIVVSSITFVVGQLPIRFIKPSFVRVCITTASCLGVFFPTVYIMLEKTERQKVNGLIKKSLAFLR